MKFLENLNCGKTLKKKNAPTEQKEDKKISCNSQIGEGIVTNLGTELSSWGDFVIGEANEDGYFPLTSPTYTNIPVYLLIVDDDDNNMGTIQMGQSPYSSGVRDAAGLSQWFQKRANNYSRVGKRFDDSFGNMASIFETLASLNSSENLNAAGNGGRKVDESGLGRRQKMTDEERAEFEKTHQRTEEERRKIREEWEAADAAERGPIMNEEQKAKVAYVFRTALNGALEGSCEDHGMPYNLLSEPEPKKDKQGNIISMPMNGPETPIKPGFFWSRLSNDKTLNCLKTSLRYKSKVDPTAEHWLVKFSLSCNFSEVPYVWTFDPDANPEKAQSAKFKTATHLDWTNPTFYEQQEMHTEDLSEKALRSLYYELSGVMYEIIDAYLEAPPDRIYPLLWADGKIKMSMIKGLSPKGIKDLVKLGLDKKERGVEGKVLTGDTVLQERPELWEDMLKLTSTSGKTRAVTNGQAVWSAAEKSIKADKSIDSSEKDKALAKAIRAIVNAGLMPQERAQQLIPDKAKRAGEEEPIKYKGSGVVKTSVDEWIEKVKNGTYRPGQVYQQNNDTLKPMIEQKLITPHDAYQLNPRILMWMLREHHIGRKEAMELDKHARDHFKQDARRKGKDPTAEWESLEASRKLNCTRNDPAVFYYEDDYSFASPKAVQAALGSEFAGFDVNVTKSGDLYKVTIFAPDELAAEVDMNDLHDAVNDLLTTKFEMFERDNSSSGLGLEDDTFGSEDPFAEENTGRVDDLGRKWNKDATIQGKEAGWEDIYNTVLKRERAIRGNSSIDMDSALIDVDGISIGSNNATEPLNSDFWTDAEESGDFELATADAWNLEPKKEESIPSFDEEFTDEEIAYLSSLDEKPEKLASSKDDYETEQYDYNDYVITGSPRTEYVCISPYGKYSPKSYPTVEEAVAAINEDLAYKGLTPEGEPVLRRSDELDDMYDDYVKQHQEEDEFWYPDVDEEDDWDPWDDVMRDRASEVGAKGRL